MNDMIIVALGFLAFAGFAFLKLRKKKAPTKSATPWSITQGRDVPTSPTMVGNGWYIDVPASPGYLAYVAWVDQPKLSPGQTIRMTYRVEGGPLIATEYPASPADCGLMIQRLGDSLSARGKYAGYRWFNRQHLPLTEGEHSVTVRLDEAEWGPVMSDPQAASFAECLENVDTLNIVFGGAGGRGHGVYAAEPTRFTLLSMVVS